MEKQVRGNTPNQRTMVGEQNTQSRVDRRARAGIKGLTRAELLLLASLLVVTFLAHAVNLRHYPTLGRLNDEGIYSEQAWSVLKMGRLSPYTYWYDHAPAGWILMAGWMGITGGPNTFGAAVDSGRVLMLLLDTASVLMLYLLARKLDVSIPLAGLAAFLYALSPLALSFGRMVLLDNIMVFWLLLSLNLVLTRELNLLKIFLSGITFGLAVLSKEPAIFLLPVLLYIVYRKGREANDPIALFAWIIPMAFMVILYPMYALMRGELISMPIANSPFDSHSGVYLIDTLRWQTSRSAEGGFFQNARLSWIPVDPILFIFGTLAMLANLVIGFKDRRYLIAGLLGIFPMIYIARGGLVFDFYILFALPFLSLNLVMFVGWLIDRFNLVRFSAYAAAVVGVIFVLVNLTSGQMGKIYNAAPDQPYRQGLEWIQQNAQPYSMMVIPDNYWVDLHDPGRGKTAFPNAHSYWKVGTDPAVRDQLFKNDFHNVNYVILFPGTREEIQNGNHTLTLQALENATQVQRFEQAGSFVEIWQVNDSVTPTGPVEIPRTNESSGSGKSAVYQQLLKDSYTYMKTTFSQEGRYTSRDGSVTSESQAYAMERAVWMDDRDEFNLIWQWTQANMMNPNGLLSWQWKDGAVTDPSSNAGADTQAALALLMAGRQWGDQALIDAGTALVQAIRTHEVITINNRPYMAAGDWAVTTAPIALNPSYFSPFAYRVFNQADPEGGWLALIDSGYQLISEASNLSFNGESSSGLPPDWVGIQRDSGQLARMDLQGTEDSTRYGYIAPRVYWQVALDWVTSQESRAQSILSGANFIANEVSSRGFPGSVYNHDGSIVIPDGTPVANAGALGVLLGRDPGTADRFFQDQFMNKAQRQTNSAVWGDPNDLSNQEWAWFGVALFNNSLPNLWE